MRQTIRNFIGKIVGYIDTDNKGNKTVYDFQGRIKGYYKKDLNVTQNFYGQILTEGDSTGSLIDYNDVD